MNSFKRQFFFIIVMLVMLLCTGVAGYRILEKFPYIDALYMTVITLTTVGFGEVYPLHAGGRIFTIVLILLGFGVFAYFAKTVADFLATGQLLIIIRRNRMKKKIDALDKHFILCGYGRMGQSIADLLSSRKIPFVLIENDEKLCDCLRRTSLTFIEGNAHDDDIMIFAGIEKARCLITALGSDADNIFVVLTARGLNNELTVASRMADPKSEPKLRRAGANIVVSPDFVGGQRIVTSVLKPTFVEFIDNIIGVTHMEIDFDEIKIAEHSSLVGRTMGESRIGQEFNVTILTIKKHDNHYLPEITGNTVLEAGDLLIALGHVEQLARLRKTAGVSDS